MSAPRPAVPMMWTATATGGVAPLKAIDQNRAAFVDEFLRDWANCVDPNMYNFEATLRPIAMKVPAWQLYGASFVGDFRTMTRVLRGIEGAGPYINAFEAPQPDQIYSGLDTHGGELRVHSRCLNAPVKVW